MKMVKMGPVYLSAYNHRKEIDDIRVDELRYHSPNRIRRSGKGVKIDPSDDCWYEHVKIKVIVFKALN